MSPFIKRVCFALILAGSISNGWAWSWGSLTESGNPAQPTPAKSPVTSTTSLSGHYNGVASKLDGTGEFPLEIIITNSPSGQGNPAQYDMGGTITLPKRHVHGTIKGKATVQKQTQIFFTIQGGTHGIANFSGVVVGNSIEGTWQMISSNGTLGNPGLFHTERQNTEPQSTVPAQTPITPEVQYSIPQIPPTQQVTASPSSDLTQKLYALSLSGIKLGETLEEVLKNPLFQPDRQVGWFSFPTNPKEIQCPKTDVIDEYKRLKSIASDDSQDPDIRSYLDGNSEFKILKAPIKFVQVVFKYDISKEKYAVTSIEVILNIPIQYSEEIYTASVIETLKNQLGVEQQLTDRKVPFWGDGSDDSTTPCLEFRNTSLELRESKVVQKRLSDNLAQALKTAKSRMEQAAGPIGEKVQ